MCQPFSSYQLYFLFPVAAYSVCGDDWIARVVSIQGKVDVRTKDTETWQNVELQQVYCRGDTVRFKRNSRAVLELHNETILPCRLGTFQLVVKNLLDKSFNYYDIGEFGAASGARIPDYIPDRQIRAQFILAIQ